MGTEDYPVISVEGENDIPSNSKESDASEDLGKSSNKDRPMTYRAKALANGIKYTVTDVPPLPQSIMLGIQHYLTMLGATVLIPLLLCPEMGANGSQTAEVISSIFFVSGINTLVQTSIGDRYVVMQSHSHGRVLITLFDESHIRMTASPLYRVDPLVIFLRRLESFSTRNSRPLKTTVNASNERCVPFKAPL